MHRPVAEGAVVGDERRPIGPVADHVEQRVVGGEGAGVADLDVRGDLLGAAGAWRGMAVEHHDRLDIGRDRAAEPREQAAQRTFPGAAGDPMEQVVAVDQQPVDRGKRVTWHCATIVGVRWVLGLAVCVIVVACGEAVPTQPAGIEVPQVSRQIIFTVENSSDSPARFVPKRSVDDAQVGFATPDVVPPRSRIVVTLTVPTHEGWALYLERLGVPGQSELLMYGGEFRDCSGEVPLVISLEEGGSGMSLNGNMC